MKQMNLVFLFILLILLLADVSSIQEAMNVAIRNLYTKPEWKVVMERAAIPYEEMERCNVTYNYPPSLTLPNNILTVCLEEGQPPFTFNNTHGYIQEFMNLVKKELENQYSIDLTIQYHIVNGFFEIVDALDSGQCEVAASLLTSSKAKMNYVDFGCSHSATRTVLLRSGLEPSRELRTKQSLNQPDVYLGVIGALEYSVSTNNFPSAVVTQCVNMEQCYNGVENNIFHAFIHSKMELDVYASNCTRVGCSVQTLDERFQYQLAFKKVDFSPVGMTSTLLPFGPSAGDLALPKSDDYNQEVEVPSFDIHGDKYTALSLSTNGYISTKKEGGAFFSNPTFSSHNSPVIGLHAMDMDLRPTNVNGSIFYRQGIDNTTLQAINDIVHKQYFQQYLNQRQFDASWYFVYTMHDVSRYNMITDNLITAQLVIASDPVRMRTILLFSFPFGGLNDHLSPVIGIFSPSSEQNLVGNYDMVRSLEVESNVGSPGLFILRVEEPVTYISEPVCKGHYGFELQSCNYPLSMCQENGICKVHKCHDDPRCNELFCYGISGLSDSVCNGKGTCIGKNKCQCSLNWTGPTCSIPVCHDQQVEGTYDPFNEAMTDQIWSNVSGLSGYSSWVCNLPSISHPFSFGGSGIRRAETHWMFENHTDISERFMVSFRIKGCERLDFSEDIVVQIQTNSSLVTVARYTTDDYVNILNGELQNITFASQYPFKVIFLQEMHSGSGRDGWLFGDFSILHLNQCSGYGFCSTANTCSCFFGRSGALCLTESCYGVSKNDSTVCSGRGACSSGLCSCNDGFYGEKCEKASCYGVIGTFSSVCSGHGDCWETDKCSCYEGWTDEECSTAICHSISGDNSTVCSSNGQCNAPNECSCNYGYTGISCDTVTCNSKSNSDLGVCNGQGTCIEIDRCACNSYHEGPNCEFPLCHNSTITTLAADNFSNITKSLEFWETMSGYEQNPSLCSSKGGYGLVFSLNQPRELVSHLILANETLSGFTYSVRFWFVQGNNLLSVCDPIE